MSQLFRLKNGTVLLSTEAPGGIYNSGQLKKIAELCSKELAIVKATEDQRLALFVKESEVENVAKQLRAMGLGFRHYQDSLHQPISCLGELCEDHEQPAMATAMDITKEIASLQVNAPLKIGVNGCARCCTPCHTLDIAVVGDSSGYRISLGGRTQQMPEFASYFAEGVPAKELPARLKSVIETYNNLAEDGETLHDVIDRCGVSDFVKVLAPYSQDAAHREDPFTEESAVGDAVDKEFTEDTPKAEPSDDLLDVEEDLSILDEETSAADSEGAVEDDLSILDDSLDDAKLDEIPIEQGDEGSLDDDVSVDQDAVDVELNDLSFTEDSVDAALDADVGDGMSAAAVAIEDSLSPGDAELDLDAAGAIAEDDLDLDALDLDNADAESISETSDDLDAMDLDAESISETSDDLDLDETMELDEELSVDLPEEDEASDMTFAEAPLDDDIEGLPELDEDLTLDELPAPVPSTAKTPASLADDFGDDLPAELAEFSDEEESRFEQKLQASIDEESALIAKEDKDPNAGDRTAALSLLENSDFQDDEPDAIELDETSLDEPMVLDDELEAVGSNDELETLDSEALDEDALTITNEEFAAAENLDAEDEVLEPIQDTMEEFPEPGPTELAQLRSHQPVRKLQTSVPHSRLKLSAVTFQDEHMRVTFDSGAYVDFDLSALALDEERSFSIGTQNVTVTSIGEGYTLEVDGMRLFHPKTSFPAAS